MDVQALAMALPCHGYTSESHILAPMPANQACLGFGRATNDRWNFREKALRKKRADLLLSGLSKTGKKGLRSLYIDRQELYDGLHEGLDDGSDISFSYGSLHSNSEARSFYSQESKYAHSGKSAGDAVMSQSHRPTEDILYSSFSPKEMLNKGRDKNSDDSHIDEGCISCLEDGTSEVKQPYAVKLNSTSSWQHADPTVSLRNLQQPLMASGWLYLGTCGNALMTRRGNDARCFHQWGLVCERENWQEHMTDLNALCSPVGVQVHESLLTRLAGTESTAEIITLDPASALKLTSKNHQSEKVRRKSIARHSKQAKRAAPPRDLFERRSFHLCEVIFCYPFRSSNIRASNFQCLSRESLEELVAIMNQIAVGVAATGVALILFVVSRMLSVNATFDYNKIISTVGGLGLVSLSLAMKRVANVVKCMADACTRMRLPQKEHLVRLEKELQGFAYKAFPLIALCLVRFC